MFSREGYANSTLSRCQPSGLRAYLWVVEDELTNYAANDVTNRNRADSPVLFVEGDEV